MPGKEALVIGVELRIAGNHRYIITIYLARHNLGYTVAKCWAIKLTAPRSLNKSRCTSDRMDQKVHGAVINASSGSVYTASQQLH